MKHLTEAQLFIKIKERLGIQSSEPAYSLVLGSGISHGIIPTSKEMLGIPDKGTAVTHPKCIPMYLHRLKAGEREPTTPDGSCDCEKIVQEFWCNFRKLNTTLDIEWTPSGMPKDVAKAYQAVFSPDWCGGLDSIDSARNYLRSLMPGNDIVRLNGAHFYLASLLSLQNENSDFYIGKRPFSRTVFTTNFDPLLQISLQLFNTLYYVTDLPNELPVDIFSHGDDSVMHLFYAHGSSYRSFLANTTNDIIKLRKNVNIIRPELQRRGIIVLGYAGWDDCIMNALKEIIAFDGNLYWLHRKGSAPLDDVTSMLNTCSNAYFVEIEDSNNWMAKLHNELCPKVPFTQLLHAPVHLLQKRINKLDLTNIKELKHNPVAIAQNEVQPIVAEIHFSDDMPPEEFKKKTSRRLNAAEIAFNMLNITAAEDALAESSLKNGYWAEAVTLFNQMLENKDLTRREQIEALFRRAYAQRQLGEFDKAIADYGKVLDLIDETIDEEKHVKGKTLFNRAQLLGKLNRVNDELSDYQTCVAMEGISTDNKTEILLNMAKAFSKKGCHETAISIYDDIIKITNASTNIKAQAFFNRGCIYLQFQKSPDAALIDFDNVINYERAQDLLTAQALFNKASILFLYKNKYTEAVQICEEALIINGIPDNEKYYILLQRSKMHKKAQHYEKALQDLNTVIAALNKFSQNALMSFLERGDLFVAMEKHPEALADFQHVIDAHTTTANMKLLAIALRGELYGKMSDEEHAQYDFNHVINSSDATGECLARALLGRSWFLKEQGNTTDARNDLNRLLAHSDIHEKFKTAAFSALKDLNGKSETE